MQALGSKYLRSCLFFFTGSVHFGLLGKTFILFFLHFKSFLFNYELLFICILHLYKKIPTSVTNFEEPKKCYLFISVKPNGDGFKGRGRTRVPDAWCPSPSDAAVVSSKSFVYFHVANLLVTILAIKITLLKKIKSTITAMTRGFGQHQPSFIDKFTKFLFENLFKILTWQSLLGMILRRCLMVDGNGRS